MTEGPKATCRAGRDGECFWGYCPQEKNYLPRCPLDNTCDECDGGEDAPGCLICNGTGFLSPKQMPRGTYRPPSIRSIKKKGKVVGMYSYSEIKPQLFTEEGFVLFIAIRDGVHKFLKTSGAFRMEEALRLGSCSDAWIKMAAVDKLVELDEILEVTDHTKVAGQHRVFVGKGS